MGTKVVRMNEDAVEIVRGYSDGSISDGVYAMHKLLSVTATPVTGGIGASSGSTPVSIPKATVSFAVPSIEGGMPESYWKKFKSEVDASIEKYSRGY